MNKVSFHALLLAGAFLFSGVSIAADYEPPPPVDDLRPATYDWSGMYVGAWAGVACVDGRLNDIGGTPGGLFEMSGCGGKGGVLAGYNHQFQDFVLGVEGDWGITDKVATNEDAFGDFSFSMNSIATLRARAGWALDDTLLFVTAGGAYARGDIDGIVAAVPDHIKADHWGWTIGGGIEHAVTDNFRLRLDYLYTQLGSENYNSACCELNVDPGSEHEVRLHAIWAFNWF